MSHLNPKKILITSQDGLIPGNIIANYLNIENIEFINLKISPTNKINNDEIKKFIISKKEILIIDSLICTDRTTEGIRKKMPKSKIAVLYTKTKCKNKADLSLYNFKDKDWIIFPWENKDL